MKKTIKVFIAVAIILIMLMTTTIFIAGPLKSNKNVVLNKNSTLQLAKILHQEKIIYDTRLFWIAAQIMNKFNRIKAGEYHFEPGISTIEIIKKMQKNDVIIRKILIPEGFTTYQVLKTVDDEPYLSGRIQKDYNEGDLLPETYFFTYGDDRESLTERMYQKMSVTLENLWQNRQKSLILKNKKEALILASIVEKEAKSQKDRKLIASVFLNRLKKNMKLDADPTVIYGITKGKHILKRPLTYKDLKNKSKFNTYINRGLPPTPIANPGIASIESVLNPIKSNYIFFVVSDCKGNHTFSNNQRAHLKNVAKYRKLKCNIN